MIALYLNEDTPPLYRAVYRQPNLNTVTVTLKVNTTEIKLLSFHEIEGGNIPTRFPAHTEQIAKNDSLPQGKQ